MKNWISRIDYIKKMNNRERESKKKWKEIQEKKKMGIQNPYDHFINNLPTGLPKLATITL